MQSAVSGSAPAAGAGADSGSAAVVAAGPKPRLMIMKMVMENFKSYGGIREIGPFHKCFSAVVGPNGSGKSNVIDAMLFVFGKRANQIRLKNIAELIHNSRDLPNVQRCSVCVHFALITDHANSDDGYDVVPGSEFTITRTADINSQSTYAIDDRNVPMSVVEEKLMSYGIDLKNNRFLILQGEVEQISMMKPKAVRNAQGHVTDQGLLEYLEEIIGSNQLAPAIEVAEQRLARLNEHRAARMRKFKMAEKELAAVATARDEAIEALELDHSLHTCLATRVAVNKHNSDARAARERQQIEATEAVLAEHRERAQDTFKEMEAKKAEIDEMKASHQERNAQLKQMKELFNKSEHEDVVLRTRIAKARDDHGKAEAQLAKAQELLAKAEEESAAMAQQVEPRKAEIAKKQAEQEKIVTETEELFKVVKERSAGFKTQMEAVQAEMREFTTRANEAKAKIAVIDGRVKTITDVRAKRKAAHDKLGSELREAEAAVAQLQADIARAEREVADMDARKATLQGSIGENAARRQALEAARNAAHSAVVELRERRLESNANRGRIADFLMAQKRGNSDLTNLYGVLGDLGTIDPMYDVAISTACGALRNFLVDTSRTARVAVDVLKRNNAGRSTFICLDQQSRAQQMMQAPFTAPEGSKRLFDLLAIREPRFAAAFYSVVRDTLVVEDLETARRVAFSPAGSARHRVVTLAGELIETTGAISGGGSQVFRGAMKLASAGGRARAAAAAADQDGDATAVTDEMVKRAEAELREAEAALARVEQERASLPEQLRQLARSLSTVREAVSMKQDQLAYNKERVVELRGRIDAVAEKAAQRIRVKSESGAAAATDGLDDEAREDALLKELAAERKVAEDAYAQATRDGEPKRAEIERLKRKILEGGGDRLQAMNKTKTEMEKHIAELNSELSRWQAVMESFPARKQKLEQELLDHRADADKHKQEGVAAKTRLAEVEQEALRLLSESTEIKREMTELANAIEAAEAAMQDVRERTERLRSIEADLVDKLAESRASLAEVLKELEHWTAKLEEFSGKVSALADKVADARTRVTSVEVWQEARVLEMNERRAMFAAAQKNKEEILARAQLNGDDEPAVGARRGKRAGAGGKKDAVLSAQERAANEALALAEDLMSGQIDMDEDEESIKADEARAREADLQLPAVERPADFECPSSDMLERVDVAALDARIQADEKRVAAKRAALGGDVVGEYKRQQKDFLVLSTMLQATTMSRDSAKAQFEALRMQRFTQFMTGFKVISLKLKEMYQMLTMGGDAELELQDTLDPFAEGIVFSVRPLNKSWKAIQNLSGGEKTLSSLALVFALHHYKPTPLYVMDEIDAALDFKNVSIVANYIKERTKNAQFIIISLRNNMFELADRLVGIYKTHNITKSVTIDPRCFEDQGEANNNNDSSSSVVATAN